MQRGLEIKKKFDKTDRGENEWQKSNKRRSSTQEANFILSSQLRRGQKLAHDNKQEREERFWFGW